MPTGGAKDIFIMEWEGVSTFLTVTVHEHQYLHQNHYYYIMCYKPHIKCLYVSYKL